MIAHEIAGVLLATIVAVAFISAIQPGSQMGSLLSSSTSGWATVLNALKPTQAGA